MNHFLFLGACTVVVLYTWSLAVAMVFKVRIWKQSNKRKCSADKHNAEWLLKRVELNKRSKNVSGMSASHVEENESNVKVEFKATALR